MGELPRHSVSVTGIVVRNDGRALPGAARLFLGMRPHLPEWTLKPDSPVHQDLFMALAGHHGGRKAS